MPDIFKCKYCGETGFHWQPTPNGARLFDANNQMHQVNSDYPNSSGKFYVVGCKSGIIQESQAISIAPIAPSADIDTLREEISKTRDMALGVTLQVANIGSTTDQKIKDIESDINIHKQDILSDFYSLRGEFEGLDRKWSDIAESKREVVIKVADRPEYSPNGPQHEKLEIVVRLLAAGLSVYVRGAAGSGKTTGAYKAGEILGRPVTVLPIGPQTSKTDIFGYYNASGAYIPSLARIAWEEGHILVLDEVDSALPGMNTYFNMFAEQGTNLIAFPDRIVERHKDYAIMATANTYGLGADAIYIGRNQQDGAFLDRFAVVNWDYQWDFVAELADNYDWTMQVRAWFEAASETKCRVVIGPRAAIEGAVLLANGFSESDAAEMKVWAKISPEDRKKIEGATRVTGTSPTPYANGSRQFMDWETLRNIKPSDLSYAVYLQMQKSNGIEAIKLFRKEVEDKYNCSIMLSDAKNWVEMNNAFSRGAW